jgi:hypothetical protein
MHRHARQEMLLLYLTAEVFMFGKIWVDQIRVGRIRVGQKG